MVSPMRLPLGLLEEIALHLIAQTCPLAPRTPPISATEEELDPRPQDVGQLWCTSRSHPVRILSQVCSPLRRIVRKHIWRVVYVYDSLGLDELERMYRYLRCVDGGALAAWTQEFTYSNWSGAWDELGAPEELDELPIYREGDDALQVDANGFVIEEEGRLSDWPAGASFLQGNYMATGADIWALHRFVFGQLSSVERLCWRSQIDPGTIWRGSSLMHVIGRLPKLRCFQVDQSYPGGWFYARNLLHLTRVREFWIDCDRWLKEHDPDGDMEQTGVLQDDQRKRFLTTCNIDKLVTTHFEGFEDADVIAALACIDVVVREPGDEENREDEVDLELGQAAASLRPALLVIAAPSSLTAQDVRSVASSDTQLARIKDVVDSAAEDIARRFNTSQPNSEPL